MAVRQPWNRQAWPFHFISTPPPPMEEVNQDFPLRNQRSKVPTRIPPQKLPNFSFPLRKKPIFFQTPRKYSKDQRRRRSDPLRNDDQGPLRKSLPSGGCGY